MNKIIVIYHKNCSDGFGAAWAAWKNFGNEAEYVPLEPRGPILDKIDVTDADVYVLDNCIAESEIEEVNTRAHTLVIIDHHETNESIVRKASSFVFDIEHSAAVLAWKYFHPSESVPHMLLHIEDFDLWHFTVPHTKEFFAYLDAQGMDFGVWDQVAKDLEDPVRGPDLIERGALVLRYENELLDRIVERAEPVIFEGYETLAVNSSQLNSQVGHRLYEILPPIAIVWSYAQGEIRVSLRANGTVDVGELAAKYGGGGHPQAAGFSFPFTGSFPWKRKALEEKNNS